MLGGRRIKKDLETPMRVVGFAVPAFIALFAIISQLAQPGVTTWDIIKVTAISTSWVILGTIQFFSRGYPKTILILYHVLASISLLSMYFIMSPFLFFWILLLLASYIRYQLIGMSLSLLWLLLTLTISTALTVRIDPYVFTQEVSVFMAALTASYVIVVLSRSQEHSRKLLQKSKERESLQRNRLLSIINNQSDGILSVDKNAKIQVYNAASMGLLDTNEDLIGKKINDAFPLYTLDKKPLNTFKTLTSYKTNTTRDDILFKAADGEYIRLEVTFAPIRHAYGVKVNRKNDLDGYILIFRDVTKEKTLDDERNEFISVVSHELRTPVTVAEGAVSNAKITFDSAKAPPEVTRNSLKIAHEQILFLAHLINDLSTLSRAQRDVMNDPEEIKVEEMGYRLLDHFSKEAKEKGLRLDLDMQPKLGTVYTSRLYLQELLQNLVQNAIKYTEKGSITIKIHKKGKDIHFAVADTGIGIAKSDKEKIFEKFYRSEDFRTRETNGTGLGLFLSAQLADKMGTWLHVTSRINHGSTFYFDLPQYKGGENK